eukprot:TRINITY_DN3384_c0_g1_i2.p1 TRINITY_DN3384_c0_g1~~TRINITY_DN3384_c0_g1_i2.p1  ORF type:complete len:146 (-),score=50.58 TRINITY_DN3384_c0_g1_i2:37-474(-)
MVEGELLKKVQSSYENWISFAVKYLEENKREEAKPLLTSIQNPTKFFDHKLKLHRRLKQLNNRVVSGTENIVRIFQDSIVPFQTPSSTEKEKKSGEEMTAIDIEQGLPPLQQKEVKKRDQKANMTAIFGAFLCFLFLIIISVNLS